MRIDRTGFLKGYALLLLLELLLAGLVLLSGLKFPITSPTPPSTLPRPVYGAVLLVLFVVLIVFIIQYIGICIRRLHDIGHSWLPVLLLFIPVISSLLVVYLVVAAGEKVTNQYGPPGSRDFRSIFGFKK